MAMTFTYKGRHYGLGCVTMVRDAHGCADPRRMTCEALFAGDKGVLVEVERNFDCDYRVAFGPRVLWVRARDAMVASIPAPLPEKT